MRLLLPDVDGRSERALSVDTASIVASARLFGMRVKNYRMVIVSVLISSHGCDTRAVLPKKHVQATEADMRGARGHVFGDGLRRLDHPCAVELGDYLRIRGKQGGDRSTSRAD